MDSLSISLSSIWKLFKWLPPFFLRRIFNKQRMADLILVDVRPRYEYATVNLGDVAFFEIWFQVINLSPFDIELDRAELKFRCSGITAKTSILKKMSINSGAVQEFLVTDSLTDGQASQIANNIENHQSSIETQIEFNCKLHNFSKETGQLYGVKPNFINQQLRVA